MAEFKQLSIKEEQEDKELDELIETCECLTKENE